METTQKRLVLLDILRGFAILGTLATNIWIFAYLGDLAYGTTYESPPWWTSLEDFLRLLVLFLVSGKFLSMLAILFGVGLELKYSQARRNERKWPGIYLWLSLLLFLEGFLHYTLVMEYDILMNYAIVAVIVAFIVRNGDKAIKRCMYIFGGIHAAIMLVLTASSVGLFFTGGSISIGDMSGVVQLYQNGNWFEQILYRLDQFLVLRIEIIFVLPMNIFLFLLGVRLMRANAFASDENGRRIRRRMMKIGFLVGVPTSLLLFVHGGYFDLSVRYFFSPFLALGYMGLIAWIADRFAPRFMQGVALIGRMALSCYIAQNVLASILFYGWGFGLGGSLHAGAVIGIFIGFCLLQLLFATLWLNYFSLGPIESVRRKLGELPERKR
ncbi:DUF418 domain-containing protein [Aureibacillus halotolerans]|uniref:DUF418 domain-containing protein n=1 Tax=Aureibacillus halotolerans TaxID=1508390 RepID=A0A4R6U3M0_9BACI|nr:DUF418 domain-containing protein [Aureibacillus halotolerans]TDQ37714.1 uncharacterized protein EV213_11274 [Aureibacillus halotolerans]